MVGWNFADTWETIAEVFPDRAAVIQGARRISWRDFDKRANGVARALLGFGLVRQTKVAQYLYNCPEYLESTHAALKASLVSVNTNYRYRGDELVYLWENSDTEAVVFHGTFTEQIEEIRNRLPRIRGWLWVDDGAGPCPGWAVPYEQAAGSGGRVAPSWGRTADDLILLYTGGTTGFPKGVMWRQEDVFLFMDRMRPAPYAADAARSLADAVRAAGPGPLHCPPSPLMHATGGWSAMGALAAAGTVVLLTGRHFDAIELLDTIERERVNTVNLVGEAFARPIADALIANPGRWDLTSLTRISSTGAALSVRSKETLLAHVPPTTLLTEGLSSSEAVSMGSARLVAGETQSVGRFALVPGTRLITESGRDVVAGSGEVGQFAVSSFVPIGYYKDPERSAKTFPVIDGTRYALSGDFATLEADGTIRFIGRGSASINTGGEKVYPDEVEVVLRQHPAVDDAAVVGVPDPRFGEVVTAIVSLRPGAVVDPEALAAQVKARLAGYKAPRHVLFVEEVTRLPNGKLDYPSLKQQAAAAFGA